MKSFRILCAVFLLFGFTSFVKAGPIDFKFKVLDPTGGSNITYVDGKSPFAVSFGNCPNNIQASGCFFGYNDTTNVTFTSLDLTFDNTTSTAHPNDYVNYLNSQPATCITQTTNSLFGAANCGLANNKYFLDFSGGLGIGPGVTFILAEIGPVPGAFQGGVGTVGSSLASTPEPGSLWLITSGVAGVSCLWKRRRAGSAGVSAT